MLGISHLLISGTAASLLLQTADSVLITVGAIAGLLPDVDVSTSPAGRLFPWISGYFQKTMPHRSMTHSIVASAVIAIAKFNRTNTNVFISGDLSVEDFDTSVLPRDPYQFKFIDASPSSIKLEAAPLKVVMKFLGDEFASGSLQVRSIVSSQ